ncbi:MAG: T9SS type A sorting domain-containing protein, partial [Winogradskyella sp.]|nr:T9SS type A sorting domain-containing protein [Winogradskyella sp.]
QTIDASNLHTGVYIVKLVSGNYTRTEKIILK